MKGMCDFCKLFVIAKVSNRANKIFWIVLRD